LKSFSTARQPFLKTAGLRGARGARTGRGVEVVELAVMGTSVVVPVSMIKYRMASKTMQAEKHVFRSQKRE
jgi:hypothetical protein